MATGSVVPATNILRPGIDFDGGDDFNDPSNTLYQDARIRIVKEGGIPIYHAFDYTGKINLSSFRQICGKGRGLKTLERRLHEYATMSEQNMRNRGELTTRGVWHRKYENLDPGIRKLLEVNMMTPNSEGEHPNYPDYIERGKYGQEYSLMENSDFNQTSHIKDAKERGKERYKLSAEWRQAARTRADPNYGKHIYFRPAFCWPFTFDESGQPVQKDSLKGCSIREYYYNERWNSLLKGAEPGEVSPLAVILYVDPNKTFVYNSQMRPASIPGTIIEASSQSLSEYLLMLKKIGPKFLSFEYECYVDPVDGLLLSNTFHSCYSEEGYFKGSEFTEKIIEKPVESKLYEEVYNKAFKNYASYVKIISEIPDFIKPFLEFMDGAKVLLKLPLPAKTSKYYNVVLNFKKEILTKYKTPNLSEFLKQLQLKLYMAVGMVYKLPLASKAKFILDTLQKNYPGDIGFKNIRDLQYENYFFFYKKLLEEDENVKEYNIPPSFSLPIIEELQSIINKEETPLKSYVDSLPTVAELNKMVKTLPLENVSNAAASISVAPTSGTMEEEPENRAKLERESNASAAATGSVVPASGTMKETRRTAGQKRGQYNAGLTNNAETKKATPAVTTRSGRISRPTRGGRRTLRKQQRKHRTRRSTHRKR